MAATTGRSDWWRLTGVAVLMALVTPPAAMLAAFILHGATWPWWEQRGEPPIWLAVCIVGVLVGPTILPGVAVGYVAGLRRRWLLLAAGLSALGGVGLAILATLTAGETYGPGAAVPGLVGGSLLAVVLADRRGAGGGADAVASTTVPGSRRPRLTRCPDDRIIAGVCGGWAHARDHDPRWVRAITAVVGLSAVLLLRPLALLLAVAYVFAWLAWPLADREEPAAGPGTGTPRQPPRTGAG